jgi:hypothetical protein
VHPPFIVRRYRGRILRALNLHKTIEYTARIAPAQLGKAIVRRYRKLAAIDWACFSGLDLSADMGIHASIVILGDLILVAVHAEMNQPALETNLNMSWILRVESLRLDARRQS